MIRMINVPLSNIILGTSVYYIIIIILKLAKEYIVISEDNIIKHCHKSILYHNEELWIKKGVRGNFDNPMGSFDGTRLSEFIGCLLLNNRNSIIDPCNYGLYRMMD